MKQEAAWSGTGTCWATAGWCPLPSDASSEGVVATRCCLGVSALDDGAGGQHCCHAAPAFRCPSRPPECDSQACPVERRAVCSAVSRKLPEIHPPRTTPPEGVLGRMTPLPCHPRFSAGTTICFLGVANRVGPVPGEEKGCVLHSHSLWGCDGFWWPHASYL